MEDFRFEKLDAYRYARALVRSVYLKIEKFPSTERNALANQLQRAVVSVPSNIAEGISRKSVKDQQRFIEYSYGSLAETLCQLQLAHDLGYISVEELSEEKEHIKITAKLLSGLYKSLSRNHLDKSTDDSSADALDSRF